MSSRSARPSVALAVAAIGSAALLVGHPVTAGAACFTPRVSESSLARRLNATREKHSLAPLRVDPELSQTARVHAKEMVRAGRLAHTPVDVLASRVTRWVVLGENVGAGRSITRVKRLFMRSETHRLNVLGPHYRHVGVGTVKKGRKIWVAVVFEARSDPGTTLAMPSC